MADARVGGISVPINVDDRDLASLPDRVAKIAAQASKNAKVRVDVDEGALKRREQLLNREIAAMERGMERQAIRAQAREAVFGEDRFAGAAGGRMNLGGAVQAVTRGDWKGAAASIGGISTLAKFAGAAGAAYAVTEYAVGFNRKMMEIDAETQKAQSRVSFIAAAGGTSEQIASAMDRERLARMQSQFEKAELQRSRGSLYLSDAADYFTGNDIRRKTRQGIRMGDAEAAASGAESLRSAGLEGRAGMLAMQGRSGAASNVALDKRVQELRAAYQTILNERRIDEEPEAKRQLDEAIQFADASRARNLRMDAATERGAGYSVGAARAGESAATAAVNRQSRAVIEARQEAAWQGMYGRHDQERAAGPQSGPLAQAIWDRQTSEIRAMNAENRAEMQTYTRGMETAGMGLEGRKRVADYEAKFMPGTAGVVSRTTQMAAELKNIDPALRGQLVEAQKAELNNMAIQAKAIGGGYGAVASGGEVAGDPLGIRHETQEQTSILKEIAGYLATLTGAN